MPAPSTGSTAPDPPQRYLVPAGTRVLLALRSAVNTKSARPGDGVYLESTFPVVVGSRVLIPAGVYVQGVVDDVERHIRVKGHAKLTMHFTSIIFGNGTVVEIPGMIHSLPGSSGPRVNAEGGVEQQGGGGDVAKAAGQGAEVGAGIGTIGGAVDGHPFQGLGIGGAGGAVVGAAVALFTHGNDIDIPQGTPVEMVLQRPLLLEAANLEPPAPGTGAGYVPAAGQPKPLGKPRPGHILCPPLSLGCL